jgi:uncharacterized protein
MSQISNLYRLQQIDSQLDAVNIKLKTIDIQLIDNSSLLTAQQSVAQAEDHLKSETKKLHDAEVKSYDTRIKIELAEASLYGGKIQNPKELQELQNEVASLKRFMINLEDKQLEAMMLVEDAEAKLMWANQEKNEVQRKLGTRNIEFSESKNKLLEQIDRLEAERKAVLPTISLPDLGLYEQLRNNRNGVAVVTISSRACTACGTTLTAAVIQNIQTTGQLVRCPTCGRILYPG